MLFWLIALPMLWTRPQWKLLGVLCVAQIVLLVALVWGSSGFYSDAIEHYPEIFRENWVSLLASVPLNVGLFAVVGSIIILGRKLLRRRVAVGIAEETGQLRTKVMTRDAHQPTSGRLAGVRHLSGWARLWIVCAVPIWALGAWWLNEHPVSPYYEQPACIIDDGTWWSEPYQVCAPDDSFCIQREAEHQTCLAEEGRRYLANREVIDAAASRREREYQWRVWSRVVAVALAPLAAGLVFWSLLLTTRWIRRGFRPQT